MEVVVLGSGCSKCHSTAAMVERVAKDLGVAVHLSSDEREEERVRLGIRATPAVMIDGKLVHSGGIPSHEMVEAWLRPKPLELLSHPTRHIFFTGKGGVGKTSLSTAVALYLADCGKRVLLVSTDSASNLDEMLGVVLSNQPTPVPGAPGLSVLNIDPDAAAEAYRQRVIQQMGEAASDTDISTVKEQLSGACTTEIASFDEFSSLLADENQSYDHVIFDTAPTGHTLRLLSLPKAWSGFLAGNDRGASCLGPHSGLKMQEVRFKAALDALSNPALTTVVLVTRPEKGAIAEASRTSEELKTLGLGTGIYPLLDVVVEMADDPFLKLAMQDTDRRVGEGKPVAPSFLLACVLWSDVRHGWDRRLKRGEAAMAALQDAIDEVFESLRLIRRMLGEMPAGDIVCPVVLPTEATRGAGWVEGWRGEVFVALELAGAGLANRIQRCHLHDPSWQNWPVLEHAIMGNIVPDFPLINKSFNLSYSGHDL